MNLVDANLLLTLYWLLISAGVLLPGIWLLIDVKIDWQWFHVILQRFYLFGKLKNADGKEKFFTDVPKRYFLHFYLLGLMINVPLFVIFRSSPFLYLLFLLHMFRRLYECLHVHQWIETSQMSFIHYFIGLLHYPLVGSTIIADEKFSWTSSSWGNLALAIVLFFMANYIQYRTHVHLAIHRRAGEKIYPIPRGFWPFNYLSCPNYFAEIVIYISFVLASHRTSSMLSLLIWVVVNQSLSSLLTHRWYREYYAEQYPSSRRALIPFIF